MAMTRGGSSLIMAWNHQVGMFHFSKLPPASSANDNGYCTLRKTYGFCEIKK